MHRSKEAYGFTLRLEIRVQESVRERERQEVRLTGEDSRDGARVRLVGVAK